MRAVKPEATAAATIAKLVLAAGADLNIRRTDDIGQTALASTYASLDLTLNSTCAWLREDPENKRQAATACAEMISLFMKAYFRLARTESDYMAVVRHLRSQEAAFVRHRTKCVAESEYNKNWSTTFYKTTSCHVAWIDDFTEAGEAIPGGVEFEQRILSLHVATWHIFERGRDRCETKWTEVRDAVAAFVD